MDDNIFNEKLNLDELYKQKQISEENKKLKFIKKY